MAAAWPLLGHCLTAAEMSAVRACHWQVSLLRDGLKDGRIEAQEYATTGPMTPHMTPWHPTRGTHLTRAIDRYALWSLSLVTDAVSRSTIVREGCIALLVACLYRRCDANLGLHQRVLFSCTGLVPLRRRRTGVRARACGQEGGSTLVRCRGACGERTCLACS